MIINKVRADNVLKYSVLELNDIPTKGLIAVIGDNESGKSSIGESICFALFGRTFSLGPGELDKVIRWGESRCSIRLDFTTPDGQRYQVSRFLDELGDHGASISLAGKEPTIRGLEEVAEGLKEIIGIGYTEYIESFYLAQREISTPHPHSFAVKAMAGVDALERVTGGCLEESEQAKRTADETSTQKEEIDEQIATLALDEGYLPALEFEHGETEKALQGDRRRISALKTVRDYSDAKLAVLQGATESWYAVPTEASLRVRATQTDKLDELVAGLEPKYAEEALTAGPVSELAEFAKAARARLDTFGSLFREAGDYRRQLRDLLGESDSKDLEPGTASPSEALATTDATGATADAPPPPFFTRRDALDQRVRKARSSRRTARLLAGVLLLLTLCAWGLWGLLAWAPHSVQGQAVSGWLDTVIGDWETRVFPWLAYGAGALTLLYIGFFGLGSNLSYRLQDLRGEAAALAAEEARARQEFEDLEDLETVPLPDACRRLSGLGDRAFAERISRLVEGPGALWLDSAAHTNYQGTLRKSVHRLEQGIAAIMTAAAEEIERRHESIAGHASGIARLDGMIVEEQRRVHRHEELSGIARNLQAKIDEMAHRVKVRALAIDLLEGAIHYISQRFNTEIRNLAADSLPKFTNGRYEHLQIDENLKVKAFSNEKRNFMVLDEISSGTQRQIMLAVRLALSQKLVNSVIQGPQMLFLDEPFAFFDEGRTASSLEVLPRVSGDFTQIWVTSQTFPAQSQFDLSIECSSAQTRSPKVWRAGEEV